MTFMRKNIMECQEEAIIRYFIKRKDSFARFFHRIKIPLVRSVNRPFSLKARKRLGHVSDLQEMEKSRNGYKDINEMVDLSALEDIEFVDTENARIEPTNGTENEPENMDHVEENWDNDDCPNFDQLSVDPPYNEVDQTYNRVTAEVTTDYDSMLGGTLRYSRSGSMLTLADDEQFTNWNHSEVWNMSPPNSITDDFEDSIEQSLHEETGCDYNVISYTDKDPDVMDRCSSGRLRFTFKIENANAFFSQRRKVTSQPFECRNLPFSLNVINRSTRSTGAFLQRNETNKDIDQMEIVVSCTLHLVNPLTNDKYTRSFEKHQFRANSDWGFIDFIYGARRDLFVYDDSIMFEVEVFADPPYCYSTFSRQVTGFVGIRNQGATCYMNSLLQALFLLPKFRTSCYRIPTEMDDDNSMALALQHIFYNLQFSDTAVSTKGLTKSFGWTSNDCLTQHDIQEMMRILIDKIEHRMKNTLLEPVLQEMLQGKFISYVKCREVEFNSKREEVFYDIQLSLENADNLYESFKNYTAIEIMDNENKFDAGDFGLQAAEKGTLFLNLPPVLFLHLLRFQYDPNTNQVVKNNNFFEFYDQINLTEYVCKDENISWEYTLFAVLSHSGSGNQGHYVAYVNPSLKNNWLKFDDDIISFVHKSDAINSNFGSAKDVDEWTRSMQLNAYMLVYIRSSDADEIFAPVDPMYITEELVNSAKVAAQQEFPIHNNSNRHHYGYDINVFLNTMLESNFRFEDSKVVHRPIASMPKFFVSSDTTANEFKKTLQEAFNIRDGNQIRIWPIYHNHNNSISQPIFIKEDEKLSEYRDRNCFAVWVEMALPESQLPQFDQFQNVLIFYFYYSAQDRRCHYIHYGYHDKNTKIDQLVPLLNEMMHWSNRELNIYQETAETEIQELIMSNCLSDYANEINNTFVMNVFFEPREHDETTELHSIRLYYNYEASQVFLTMRNDDGIKSDLAITTSCDTTFPELLNMLATRVGHDPKKIQIFRCQKMRKGEPIPSTSTNPLSTLLYCVGRQRLFLYYKMLNVDVVDVETKHPFKFQWFSIAKKICEWFTLYISDTDSLENILAAAAKLINQDTTNASVQLRLLFYWHDNETVRLIKNSTELFQYLDTILYSSKKYFHIEEIPQGDEILNENENYVVVMHPSMHSRNPPFPIIAKVNTTETWEKVKETLRCRLNISELKWADYRLLLVDRNKKELEIDDTKCLNDFEENTTNFFIHLNIRNRNKRIL